MYNLNILFTVLLLLVISSCKKEQIEKPAENSEIHTLSKSLEVLPSKDFSKLTTASFVNELGDLKDMEINYSFETLEFSPSSGESYLAEEIRIKYEDPSSNGMYFIEIQGVVRLNQGISKEAVTVSLINTFNNGKIPDIYFVEGNALPNTVFENTQTIINKSFVNVYSDNIILDAVEPWWFSAIYYNNEDGVLGFVGEDGILWELLELK